MRTRIKEQNYFTSKEDIFSFFQQKISKIFNCDNDSGITLCNIQRLEQDGITSINKSYFIEFILKKSDGSLQFKQIIAKHLNEQNHSLYAYLKSQEKQVYKLCSVKIPKIIFIDYDNGYVFKEFIQGTNIENLLLQIIAEKRIKNWEKRLFERMGRGLAEINQRLKIVHGDPRTANWIYNKENDDLFLLDWEYGGKGDFAYDLSYLIYALAQRFSKFIDISDFEQQDELIGAFDEICLAITKGYTKIYVENSINNQFAGYWIHYVYSIQPKLHERIFHNFGMNPPILFRVLRLVSAPFISISAKKNRTVSKHLLKRFTIICSSILLILKKGNFEVAKKKLKLKRWD